MSRGRGVSATAAPRGRTRSASRHWPAGRRCRALRRTASLSVTIPLRILRLKHLRIKRSMRSSRSGASRSDSHHDLPRRKSFGNRHRVSSSLSDAGYLPSARLRRRADCASVGIHTKTEKIFLVDRIQHRHHRSLEYLVSSEAIPSALSPIRFRYVLPPARQCPYAPR